MKAIVPVVVTAGTPESIEAVSAGELSGKPGDLASAPVEVRVKDKVGNPVRGVVVEFLLTASGGSVVPARTVSDGAGIARSLWTLGARTGRQVITAQVPSEPDLGVSLIALAKAGDPGEIHVLANSESARAASKLEIRAQIFDKLKNPYPNAELIASTTSGTVELLAQRSDIPGSSQRDGNPKWLAHTRCVWQ